MQEPVYFTLMKDSSTSTEDGVSSDLDVSPYAVAPLPRHSSLSQYRNVELKATPSPYSYDENIYDEVIVKK